MKIFIDCAFIQEITALGLEKEGISFLKKLLDLEDPSSQIVFSWPSLLEYLEVSSLCETFPALNDQLLSVIESILASNAEEDLIIRLYDQIFVECLSYVKNLPQIDPAYLIEQIQKKQGFGLFDKALAHYERLLVENTHLMIHDLTLYLAWDRMCVYMASIFDHVFSNVKDPCHLKVLRKCLIESFQHITGQGKTVPGFFRLLEALYAYELREENLQTHTNKQWDTLCKGVCTLKSRKNLVDVPYIDSFMVPKENLKERGEMQGEVKVLTLDSLEVVKASLSLGECMIEKLNQEAGWQYALLPVEVLCIKQAEGRFVF